MLTIDSTIGIVSVSTMGINKMLSLHSLKTLTSFEVILMVSLLVLLYFFYNLYLKYRTLRCEFITFSDSIATSLDVIKEDSVLLIKDKVKQILILNGNSESGITEDVLNYYVLDSIKDAKKAWEKSIDFAAKNMKRNGIKPLDLDDKSWILRVFYK